MPNPHRSTKMNTNQNQLLSIPLIIPSHSQHHNHHHHHYSISFYALLLLILVAVLSLWAANESSKGFDVTVRKASDSYNSLAAQRFNLMYVANGKAARVIIRASQFVEENLNSNSKPNSVHRVTLQLSSQSMTSAINVAESRYTENEFVLMLNPDLLLLKQAQGIVDAGVVEAILRGMTRVHMWKFYSQLGDVDVSIAVVEEMEECVIRKASKVHLTEFHRLISCC